MYSIPFQKLICYSPFCRAVTLTAPSWRILQKAAEALADPSEYANLFPDLDLALKVCWAVLWVVLSACRPQSVL